MDVEQVMRSYETVDVGREDVKTTSLCCWTFEGRKLVACLGGQLGMYDPESDGKRVKWLGQHGNVKACTSLATNSTMIYVGKACGRIQLWDLVVGEAQTLMEGEGNLRDLVIVRDGKHAYVLTEKDENGIARVERRSLSKRASEKMVVIKTKKPTNLTCNLFEGHQYLATTDNRKVIVWDASSPKRNIVLRHTKELSCVALSPNGRQVVAGDVTGRIMIWHVNYRKQLADGESRDVALTSPKVTTRHWHSRAVGCLAFTGDGSHLLSGGEEGVLVIWQLETGKQEFLPRLGAALTSIHVCTENSRIAVSLCDSSALIINLASMKIESSMQGIKGPARGTPVQEIAGAIKVQPRTGFLALPTGNAGLQLYDMVNMEHVADLDAASRSSIMISDDGKGTTALEPRITHFAFNKDASKLITVDYWPQIDPYDKGDEFLKFWEYLESNQNGIRTKYTMVARTDNPFTKRITSVVYHPSHDLFVTTSSSGFFRIWVHDPEIKNAPAWRCLSMLSYKQAPSHCAAFSVDGSLLAAGAGSDVVLWEPETSKRIAVLGHEGSSTRLASLVTFVADQPSLVVALTGEKPSMIVWDLLSVSIKWSVELDVCCLVSDPVSSQFAVVTPAQTKVKNSQRKIVTREAHVLLFDVQRPFAREGWRVEGSMHPAALFVPSRWTARGPASLSTGGESSLVVVSEQRALSMAVSAGAFVSKLPGAAESMEVDHMKEALHGSALVEVLGDKVRIEPTSVEDKASQFTKATTQPWRSLFDMPSHTLPSSIQLCSSFLKAIMADE